MAVFSEIGIRPQQGVWLLTRYEVFDEQQGVKDNELQRLTIGFEIFPFTFMEVRPQYRIYLDKASKNNNIALWQMHIWF